MATITALGTAANKTGGATLSVNLAVDDFIILCFSGDIAVYTAYVSEAGSGGSNLSLAQAAISSNTGNVISEVRWGKVLSAVVNKNCLVGLGVSGALSITAYKVTGLSDAPFDKSSAGTGTGTTPSSGATDALSQADELVIGVAGMEDNVEDIAGSWTTGAGNVSGNEQQAGTTGGGSASNISIRSAAEIVSATTAQTAALTGVASADWAALVATFKVAASGTQFNQSISGGLTPAGAIIKQDRKPLTGGITPTGAAIKQTRTAKTGTLSLAGTVFKQLRRGLAGALTAAGTLSASRFVLKILAGALTISGTLAKRASPGLSGSMPFSGTLIKKTNRALTGTLTGTGFLATAKVVLKSLAGTLTSAGNLTKRASHGLAGELSFTGALVKKTYRNLTGMLSTAGALAALLGAQVFYQSLAGTLSAAGTLSRQTRHALTGGLTGAGTLIKQIRRGLAGSLPMAGTVSRVRMVFMTLAGTLTSAGVVNKQTRISTSGTVTFSGTIAKRIGKLLSGLLTSLGELAGEILGTWVSTPDSRRLSVSAETRVLQIMREIRTLTIEPETRAFVVPRGILQ